MTETLAPPQATERRLPGTPFVGLVPYGEGDAAFFFGRDEEKEIVAGNLRAARLTILYGASGAGKTSLLLAGVVHDLHEQVRANAAGRSERTPFAVCAFSTWRDDPLPALAEAMRAAAVEALGGEELPPWRPGEPLVDAVRAWTERVRPLLVVLDQFEDYFLYHPDEDGEGTFAVEFPRLVNELNLRVNFVLSLREDAWAKLDRFEGRIPALFANYVRVEHLDRKAAQEAIDGPVREWNRRLPPGEERYEVEPALGDAVIEAAAAGRIGLTEGSDGAGPQAANTDAVEAPFLQLVLERLWRATVEAGTHTIDLARLEALGGAQQIVENHLLEALGKLKPGEQAVAADLFKYLVTRSKTKIAHPASDLAEWTGRPELEVSAVLDKLCRGESGRILRSVSPPAGETAVSYELFHDVLAEPILDWRRGFERERDRRLALKRFARVGGMLLSLVAVFAALGIWALVQRSDARHATTSATSLALASTANELLDSRPDVSLLLSLAAYDTKPTVEAASSMISALEKAQSSGAKAILHGHTDQVTAVAFSPDGSTLATGSWDSTVRLWDVRTQAQLGEPLRGHEDTVQSVAFSPDEHTLASGSDDKTVLLWDVDTQKQRGKPLRHRDGVQSVAFSPDGQTLASGSDDKTVLLWDVDTQKQRGKPLRHTDGVQSVAFSPDGQTLASGSSGTVLLWDVSTQIPTRLGQLSSPKGVDWPVAFSPDGRTLATATADDNTVLLWDVDTQKQRGKPLLGHTDGVLSLAFSRDGRLLASGSIDKTVRLWDVDTQKQRKTLRGHTDRVSSVAFSPDERTTLLASGSWDTTVRLWDMSTHAQLGKPLPAGHTDRVLGLAFSPDGRTLATGSYDNTVLLWDLRTNPRLGQPLPGEKGDVYSVAFSPDGRRFATGEKDGTVLLWDVATNTQHGKPLDGHTGKVTSVAFSPDGRTLASGGADNTVRLWDVDTQKQRGKPLPHKHDVYSVAFSPDGHTLATGSNDETVRLWDVDTQKQRGEPLLGHFGAVYSVAFSPDGHTLATGGYDSTVRLWDVRTQTPLGQPLRHRNVVGVVAFSPDGRTLATGDDDKIVRLWDVRTHTQLGQPLDHKREVTSVAFSPDGRTIATGDSDGTVRLWEGFLETAFAGLQTRVCGLVANLTLGEWQQFVPGLPYRTPCPG